MTKASLPAPWPLLILLALLTLPAGCLSLGEGTRQSTRFFTLAALENAPLPDLDRQADSMHPGLGPLRFPAYLDRPQLVTRRSAHEMQMADFSRWAEPLNENFARTLAENLGVLLGHPKIAIFPWPRALAVSHQIRLDILRFDSGPDQLARLQVNWDIVTQKGGPPVVSRQS
ncbi:PqiC family protein, partial [Geoalkalibacter sp.]|uniref:PqiC family protein n=1 Tax=Geoalkalibacter sp. TaxID=3041440 RepID=UPI00272E98CC